MIRTFGPVLHARGEGQYTIVAGSTGDIGFSGTLLTTHRDMSFYRRDFTTAPGIARYEALGQTHEFHVPTPNQPLRLAFAACNGSEKDEPGAPPFPAQNAMWAHLNIVHQTRPYHLMLQGGDQIYADSVWQRVPYLAMYKQLPRKAQYTVPLPDEVRQQVRDHYFETYLTHWGRPELKQALSAIPQLMMWDDHDIFDGWGSWNDRYQKSPVYQGVFRTAREAFNLFQRGLPEPAPEPASWAARYGEVGIIAPDLRSQRTRKDVMGDAGHLWLEQTLQRDMKGCKELVVVASVPLATAHFSALDPLLTGLPSTLMRHIPHRYNPKQFADDIHDQWRVPAHRKEWQHVLGTLLGFSEQNQARITVVSGEIHLGARSTISRGATHINQYIASGIAHKPAHWLVVKACEWLSKGTQNLPGGIDVRMEKFVGSRRYLATRNYLELDIDPRGENKAIWQAENHPTLQHQQRKLSEEKPR
jgi:PhoD related phosphatase